jgi:hypothetical protein
LFIHVKIALYIIKQSLFRPAQALMFPGGLGSQISRQSAHEGSKVVNTTHRQPLLPQEIPDPQGHLLLLIFRVAVKHLPLSGAIISGVHILEY